MRHARTPKFQLSGPTVHSLYCVTGAARTITGGGEYSYMCVLLNQLLLKSIVFTVCEHKYMNICPLNYRSAGATVARTFE